MAKPIFKLEKVWKTYESKGVQTHALRGVDLEVKKGEYTAILGPSGSGKSTLMHIMGCLDTPTKGRVVLDGKDASKLSSDRLVEIRREKIGFVFQSYNLIPGLNAVENVALPIRFRGESKNASTKKAKNLLDDVGLGHRMDHRPNELSGGEQQRVAIARSLANNPEVILADEPTGNLDTKTGDEITKLIYDLHKTKKKTILIVTHDSDLANKAERRILIKDGKIIKGGKTKDWINSV